MVEGIFTEPSEAEKGWSEDDQECRTAAAKTLQSSVLERNTPTSYAPIVSQKTPIFQEDVLLGRPEAEGPVGRESGKPILVVPKLTTKERAWGNEKWSRAARYNTSANGER